MSLEEGARLGPYVVVARLGAGGMGEVFRARDERLDREVAIKVLPAAARADREARARFRREALALSRLNHPNIEMVLDIGVHEGTDYLVLEYVPGETLAGRLARGPVPEREAAELAAQIAEALAESHERGVLHRDLKAGNVMVTPKGRIKVLDFGLARLSVDAGDETRSMALTQIGTTAGTLAYMAPEQLLGEAVDSRADLYALGVVLYEMVTGRRPFRATLTTALANEVLHGHLESPRAVAPGLSARIEAVILRAMERDPGRRYQTGGEMAGELRRLAAGESGDSGETAVASGAPARRVTSIAVLPLENLSGDPSQEFFSDGMTEELIASLAQVRALRVTPRTSVMRYKGQHRAIPEVARELNVDAVVEGSVRRGGERVRITAQLIDAATERHLWAKSYERDMKEVLALQGEVAAAIVEEIQVSVTPQEETRLRGGRTVIPEAYEAYLKGRHAIERRTEEELVNGLAVLDEAVRLDPAFELAQVGVADAHNLMGFMTARAPRETFPLAMAAARRALEINPRCAEALTSLAYATMYHAWDLPEAERLFRRSIDLNPRYAQAHLWFGNMLALRGRIEEADAQGQMARIFDPQSHVGQFFSGWFSYMAGHIGRSRERMEQSMSQIPEFAAGWYWLGLGRTHTDDHAGAVEALERAVVALGGTPQTLAGLAIAHARAGDAPRARSLLAELESQSERRYVGAYYLAQVRCALGDHDAALDQLDRAFEERAHWLIAVRNDPSLAALRGYARFEALAARVGDA